MKSNKLFGLLKSLYIRFKNDEIPALGAQLTYYLVLSFFPFLIFLFTLVSYTSIATDKYVGHLERFLPMNVYELITDVVQNVLASRDGTLLSLGMIATIWAASNGVAALMRGINKAYDQQETRPFWKVRALSILFTLGLAMVFLFSFTLLVLGEVLGRTFFNFVGQSDMFKGAWNVFRYIFSLVIMMIVFILIYYYTPNRRLFLKEVIPGALFSTLGWIAISLGFSYYVSNFGNFSRTYGSIGGIIALLIWLYWSSIIILLGGEINATLAFDMHKADKEK